MMLNWKEDTLLGHHARLDLTLISSGRSVRIDARVRDGVLSVGIVEYDDECVKKFAMLYPMPLETVYYEKGTAVTCDRTGMQAFERWVEDVLGSGQFHVIERDL